ncbi:MAG TPA: 30S ribosomal protein S18 [Candidatus Acidoferrum sp.]|jgi:small subunit ribosomal protein S18|nr:30S ribosomal protein S18 [Candidatus Acidoferrum sp.]
MADEQAPRPAAPPAAPTGSTGYQGGSSGGHSAPSLGGGHSGPPRFGGPGGSRPGGPGARPGGPAKRGKRNFVRKKKVCRFCVDKSDYIDYKRAEILAPFLQERGKILPRRMTGTCARHQRWLTVAIKRAQNIALLPFAAEL